MIYLKNICKSYHNSLILKDLDLTVSKGEFVILLGPSGCGKTTLLNIIGLMDNFNKGNYYFNDINMAFLKESEKAKFRNQTLGFVFQSFQLINHLTLKDNVGLPLGYGGVSKNERREKSLEVLEKVGLSEKADLKPNQLSGGQKQRGAIARAIVNNPSLILADEPTGNLDSKSGKNIMDLLKQLNSQQQTIIMTTHNEYYTIYADSVYRMLDGALYKEK